MQMKSLQDLLVDVMKDTYDAEHQITQALPKMAQTAHSMELKAAFQEHLEQTRSHIQRLERAFQMLGQPASRKSCRGMQGLIEEGQEMMNQSGDADVIDAGLIAAAQKVEHYEIAAYGTARAYAEMLGKQDVANLFQQTLDEEGQTDKKLTQLAERRINRQAAQ